MLTADLVEVRRRGDRLLLRPLSEEERTRASLLSETYLGLARAHLGGERGQLLEAWRQVPLAARERRLGAGLVKLVLDRCSFEPNSAIDSVELRAQLFARATQHRRELPPGADFDRGMVAAEVAAARGLSPSELEQALYADLPDAHRLRSVGPGDADALVTAYEAAGVSAVLLRATQVRVLVRGATPAAFRSLFHKLKFLRLLHRIEEVPAAQARASAAYQITIDGPFSLFESVSKYGLQLALAFPAIAACGEWSLEAEVRWGKERRPLTFAARGTAADRQTPDACPLPDDVAAVLEELMTLKTRDGRWQVRVAQQLIDLPGAGILVPDLELTDSVTGVTVFVELLGFWSREAVWRRVELAERGLPVPVVFVAGKHLRVSQEALPSALPAALYIYNRRIIAPALLERAETVATRFRGLSSSSS